MNVANSPWVANASLPARTSEAAIAYPAAIFSNPAMFGPAVSLAPPPPAPTPKPSALAAAPNALHGVALASLATGVPGGTRTDAGRAFTCGAGYKLYPEVAKQPNGKDAIVYWKAFNKEAKRVDFLVGPDSLSTFTSVPSDYATAAANAYMGEQDAATLESARVVDLATRKGFGPAIRQLVPASVAAWTDPKWLAKTAFNTVTALAAPTGASAAGREARAESSAASGAAPTVPGFTYKSVNPGYPAAGRTMNCVNCAVATDATLAGHPASALPVAAPLQLADVQDAVGGSFVSVGSPADVETALRRGGDGSRAVVAGFRADPDPGHVFNAVNEGGRIKFVDGQSGAPAVLSDPSYTDWAMLQTHPRKP